MKTFVFLIMTMFSVTYAGDGRQELDLKAAIEQADFVGFIIHDDKGFRPGQFVDRTCEVLKGDPVNLHRSDIHLAHVGVEYLLVVSVFDDTVSEFVFPMTERSTLSDKEIAVLDSIPCYSEQTRKDYEKGVCHRDFSPVCGCDGRDYGNVCGMRKHGITKYKPGRCPKKK